MPRYDYRCAAGHVTEGIFPIGEAPQQVACTSCEHDTARRVFSPPAAIHFHGPGFYATDVKSKVGRRRRPNAGDSLPKEFDTAAARIADAI